MEVTYYPGCSLTATARDYDESIRTVCGALAIGLKELDDWTCCGATSAHAMSKRLSVLLPAANLPAAEKAGLPVLVPCPMCFNRLKRSQKEVGSTIGVHDLSSFLGQPEMLEKI
ncbi:MAG: heterodisulfide reductase-related iron-sulfur binding cluster, partial [Thermodesulfobacteriota bacterium]